MWMDKAETAVTEMGGEKDKMKEENPQTFSVGENLIT